MFSKTSRYYELPDQTWVSPDGREVTYKSRRFLPRDVRLGGVTSVAQSERLDLVAFRTLRQPDQFWRLCDANSAMSPFDLVEPSGQVLRLPES
jgi:hypothetical protein